MPHRPGAYGIGKVAAGILGFSMKYSARSNGQLVYLSRAVDQEGEVLDILVRSKRNAKAATRFVRKLLKGLQYRPLGVGHRPTVELHNRTS